MKWLLVGAIRNKHFECFSSILLWSLIFTHTHNEYRYFRFEIDDNDDDDGHHLDPVSQTQHTYLGTYLDLFFS